MSAYGMLRSSRVGGLARRTAAYVAPPRPCRASIAPLAPLGRRQQHSSSGEAAAAEPEEPLQNGGSQLRSAAWKASPKLSTMYPSLDTFAHRHIGPDDQHIKDMLKSLSPPAGNIDEFVSQVIPGDILARKPQTTPNLIPRSESEVLALAHAIAGKNEIKKSYLGGGYHGTLTPEVIKRNILENPAWYTSYTPYQPEISQGRLESLLNFQTMVSDLTALPISNASLLDEGTAAAEAMSLSVNSLSTARAKRKDKIFYVSHAMNKQVISVVQGRAEALGLTIELADVATETFRENVKKMGEELVGVMVQYPDRWGGANDFKELADIVHEKKALLSCSTDLLALTVMTPPGEWGADIAFGNAQRFGVPMGYGGPHAAFFAVGDKHKRKMPGRLVGVSKDRLGNRALRLALQTREQHIRREKATSNVCTSQALLANISAMYAIYHGPEGLKAIAERVMHGARTLHRYIRELGFRVEHQSAPNGGPVSFDTVLVRMDGARDRCVKMAETLGLEVRTYDHDRLSITLDETTDVSALCTLFGMLRRVASQEPVDELLSADEWTAAEKNLERLLSETHGMPSVPPQLVRKSSYLTHPVFNSHHSETEMLRYIHHLQAKDLSLVHSMIPLGSCTMKLNGGVEMATLSMPGFSNLHPHTAQANTAGYKQLFEQLSDQLNVITGMDATSLQPNSGAQGEYAGLKAIRKYQEARGETERDICLIPVSAHGTNPASAAMAGMRVVPLRCEPKTGNLDLTDLEAKCNQYSSQIGAIMITYPSTYGIFEPHIRKVCEIVHSRGGQVYMDGANMNAQIGLCSPGAIGADVCHLNLHKTFCIPHGGGGPGAGPICVKSHLAPHLPGEPVYGEPQYHDLRVTVDPEERPLVSSSPYGSASILPISWAYNTLMGARGLRQATEATLLSANYLLGKLKPHYEILYVNDHGRCAHEFVLDARPFGATAGIEAIDIAKRLQDYGFHAPTMSWPVAGTLMIEPTESESKEELDRFVEALVSIRQEIRDIETGKAPRERNVLKMAPHPVQDVVDGDAERVLKWDRPYTREQAVYPLPWLREKKFWPSVARIDDAYGDMNLFCTCPPVEDTTQPGGGGTVSSIH